MRFITLAIICSLKINLEAQISMQVQRPQEFSARTAQIWNCVIINAGNTSRSVYLHAILTQGKKGKLAEANSAVFTSPIGSLQINHTNYNILNPENVIYKDKTYEEHIVRTNTLPNGMYTVCLTLFDAQTKAKLAENCMNFTINQLTPMNLVFPADRSEICEPNPLFIWTPYRGSLNNYGFSYQIKIVEVLKSQKPNSAVKTNPCYFCTGGIQETKYQYPFTGLPFQDNQRYAWYISIVENKKEISISPVWEFTWKDCISEPLNQQTEDEKEEEELVSNKKIQGKNYYFLSHLGQSQDEVTLNNKDLNFYFENISGIRKVLYSIQDGASILLQKEMDVTDSYNYFTTTIETLKLSPNKKYMLKILCDNADQYTLKFSIQKNN